MRDSPLLTFAQRVFDPTIRFAMKNVLIVLILEAACWRRSGADAALGQ